MRRKNAEGENLETDIAPRQWIHNKQAGRVRIMAIVGNSWKRVGCKSGAEGKRRGKGKRGHRKNSQMRSLQSGTGTLSEVERARISF